MTTAVPCLVGGVLVALLGACSGGAGIGDQDPVGTATTAPTGPVAGPGTGDLLVTGTVLDDGAPLAGAEVNLLVYPARPDPTATEPTPPVEVTPVRTGGAGTYAVTLPPSAVPGEYLVPLPDGSPRLEFAVVVDDGERTSSWSEVAALVAAGTGSEGRVWRSPGGTGEDAVLRIDLDLGEETVSVTGSDGEPIDDRLPSR